MLDAVIEFMPSPIDIPPVPGHDEDDKEVVRKADDSEKFAALAFKLMTDPYVGPADVRARVLGRAEVRRLGLQPDPRQEGAHRPDPADARQPAREIKEILAGDIAACVGLKDVTTGETLCDPDAIITLEKMVFPSP
jgi:elongation factor G